MHCCGLKECKTSCFAQISRTQILRPSHPPSSFLHTLPPSLPGAYCCEQRMHNFMLHTIQPHTNSLLPSSLCLFLPPSHPPSLTVSLPHSLTPSLSHSLSLYRPPPNNPWQHHFLSKLAARQPWWPPQSTRYCHYITLVTSEMHTTKTSS